MERKKIIDILLQFSDYRFADRATRKIYLERLNKKGLKKMYKSKMKQLTKLLEE
tara:strand:- start:17845 stop:18006 length:162 start_codon:yes stop_codon:yes gene_type:complete